jgi:hypothetical protein
MKRFKYRLNHYRLLTGDMGQLLPCAVLEVLPGDTFRHFQNVLLRTTPLATPVMHNVNVRVHSFFVPNRLVWDGWETFITGSATPTFPTHTINTGSDDPELLDHMGVPFINGLTINELPIRAYNMVWNEFFRDPDIGTERNEDDLTLARVMWAKDYFTSARANAQQGSELSVAFDGTADVTRVSNAAAWTAYDAGTDDTSGMSSDIQTESDGTVEQAGGQDISFDPEGGLQADLSTATGGIGINDLRFAIAQQRFAEARAHYGERYVDYLRWLGVRPRDGRLDRPEYLGSGSRNVAFSEVIATAETGSTVDVGDLKGHGIASLRTRPYRKFFEEHGYVISVLSVRPNAVYDDGLARHWRRSAKEDYWQKEHEILGPQGVWASEIYAAAADPDAIFGYTDRHREYREATSYVSGDFRNGGNSDDWHFARQFASEPSLNESFLTCSPTDRVYQATTVPELYATVNNHVRALRQVRPGGLPKRL